MEKYIEVIQKIFPLLETLQEAMNHIQKQLFELRYEEALMMLGDIEEGVVSVKNAVEPIIPELKENSINALTVGLEESVRNVVSDYNQEKQASLESQIREEVFTDFNQWKEELERVLNLYILS